MISFEFCFLVFSFSFLQGILMVFADRFHGGVTGVHVWRKAKSRECARIQVQSVVAC